MKKLFSVSALAALMTTSALAEPNPLRNAYFGETHMHTTLSLDACIGGARLMPSDSYRFAKGEPMAVNGRIKRLDRPLDFAAVSDHAEYIGEMVTTMFPDAPGHQSETVVNLQNLQSLKEKQEWFFRYVVGNTRSFPIFTKGRKPQNRAGRSLLTPLKNITTPVFSPL